ncbi:helix-turn-helix domain-containing protein [Fibrella aestuarina]|uniref:helix-turn-helix domain-containing protein n=1 Tax=Fibrella aestuarina TaxID=651143 RepID=UPI0002DAECD4
MESIKQVVAEALREALKDSGLTQKEVGSKLNVGEPTVSKYLSGNQNLTLETIDEIAKALGLKVKVTFYK